MRNRKGGFGKLLAGIGIGTGIGLLLAPRTGEETRKELKQKIDKLVEEAKKVDVNEVKDNFLKKVDSFKAEMEDLDKEKALNIAKEKGEALKVKATELVDLAKEKGTPVLEKTAEDVRKKAIEVTKEVIKRLENKK